jgi:hypothetical protein
MINNKEKRIISQIKYSENIIVLLKVINNGIFQDNLMS